MAPCVACFFEGVALAGPLEEAGEVVDLNKRGGLYKTNKKKRLSYRNPAKKKMRRTGGLHFPSINARVLFALSPESGPESAESQLLSMHNV